MAYPAGSVVMVNLFHHSPRLFISKRHLHRIGHGKPFLVAWLGSQPGHIGVVLGAVVFVIPEKIVSAGLFMPHREVLREPPATHFEVLGSELRCRWVRAARENHLASDRQTAAIRLFSGSPFTRIGPLSVPLKNPSGRGELQFGV